jgi:hypothetical protein
MGKGVEGGVERNDVLQIKVKKQHTCNYHFIKAE